MRVLVTGSAGFIGSHLMASLEDATGYDMVGQWPAPSIGDIGHYPMLSSVVRANESVVHLAAVSNAEDSIYDPRACAEVNHVGLVNVLEAAKENNTHVVFTSSAAVYHANAIHASPYAISKWAGERWCRWYETNGLRVAILRLFNVFGDGADPRSVIASFVRAIQGGRPLKIYGGNQTRDFIYVKDVVSAIKHVLANGIVGIFDVGTGVETSISQAAQMVGRVLNRHETISWEESRPMDARRSCANPRMAIPGWKPQYSLDGGLDEMLNQKEERLCSK